MSWGAIAAAAISVGAGAASSAIKNSSAQDGEMGYDIPMLSPGPWDQQNQALTAQLGQNMALNAQQGRLSPGMEILLNKIRKQQMQQAKEQMYGTPGNRNGTYQNTMTQASLGNVGPKSMMAAGSRAMNDYASRQSQIQNYIDSLKYTGLSNQQMNAAKIMQSMPRSNEIPMGAVVPMNTPAQPGFYTGLGNVDWSKLIQGTGWFDKKTTPTDTTDTVTPQYTFNVDDLDNDMGGST